MRCAVRSSALSRRGFMPGARLILRGYNIQSPPERLPQLAISSGDSSACIVASFFHLTILIHTDNEGGNGFSNEYSMRTEYDSDLYVLFVSFKIRIVNCELLSRKKKTWKAWPSSRSIGCASAEKKSAYVIL